MSHDAVRKGNSFSQLQQIPDDGETASGRSHKIKLKFYSIFLSLKYDWQLPFTVCCCLSVYHSLLVQSIKVHDIDILYTHCIVYLYTLQYILYVVWN